MGYTVDDAPEGVSGFAVRENGIVALAYIVAAAYGIWIARLDGRVAVTWPASAIVILAMLRGGPRLLPGVAIGSTATTLLSGAPPPLALLHAVPAIVEGAVALPLLRAVGMGRAPLRAVHGVHLVWIALVAAIAGGVIGGWLAVAGGRVPPAQLIPAGIRWALGDALGIVTFVPPLALTFLWRAIKLRTAPAELAAMLVAIALLGAFVLVDLRVAGVPPGLTAAVASYPVVLWFSLRGDIRTATWLAALLTVLATIGTKLGTGALVLGTPERSAIVLQVYQAACVLTTLVVAGGVAERDATLERLQKADEFFERFMHYSPVAAFVKDEDRRLTFVNDAWKRAVGAADDGWFGKRYDAIPFPMDSTRIDAIDQRVLAGETTQDEVVLRRPSGVSRWLVTKFAFDAGTQRFIGGIGIDVTERRNAEEEIARLNAELEERVQQRTEQVEATNRELEAFSDSVSHDLRAPLRSIHGFGRALLEDYGNELPAQGREYAARVVAASERMAALIDDLLRLSRLTRATLRRERVNVTRMAESIADAMSATNAARRVMVQIAPGMEAHADTALLHIVFDNLLGNAWKYTGNRPVAHIDVGVERWGDAQVFHVRDNGTGFDMRYASRLFFPFQRLHRGDEFEGTGIGLATVRRVITRHGGKVWAESVPGVGTTIRFTLDATPVDEPPGAAVPRAPASTGAAPSEARR